MAPPAPPGTIGQLCGREAYYWRDRVTVRETAMVAVAGSTIYYNV